MVLDFHRLEDKSLEPPAWFHARAFQIVTLVSTQVKTVFCREAQAELFGSAIAGLATFQSDVYVAVTILTEKPGDTMELRHYEEVVSVIRDIRGMKRVHFRNGRAPVVHATFQVGFQFIYILYFVIKLISVLGKQQVEKIEVDIVINNTVGLRKSQYLAERITGSLRHIVKFAKVVLHELFNEKPRITSYALAVLAIHFENSIWESI